MSNLSKTRLKEIWEDPSQTKIVFNAQYEAIWLDHQYGWELKGPVRDPMIGAFLLDENSTDHSLQALCSKYLQAPSWKDQFKPYEETLKELSYVPPALWAPLLDYNRSDIAWTSRLDRFITSQLQTEGLSKLFSLEMENLKTLARMTTWGMCVDKDLLQEWTQDYSHRLEECRRGFDFNPSSPQQVLTALHNAGYKVASTGEEVLITLDGDLPRKLLRHRKLQKVLSTYLRGLNGHIYQDGRIHPRFHQNRVVSGRLSGSQPNPQNFPRDDDTLQFRKLFRGTWGHLLRLDFNQLELRGAAWVSHDKVLGDVYRANKDLHDVTGESLWHKRPDQITENERVVSKITNFTALYDPFPTAIASIKFACEQAGVDISWGQTTDLVWAFRRTNEGWFRFVYSLIRQIYDTGQIRSPFGRIRRSIVSFREEPGPKLPDNFDGFWTWTEQYYNWAKKAGRKYLVEVLRSIVNSLVQGSSSGDLVKFVGTIIDRRLRARQFRSRLCNNVHDELLIDTHPKEKDEVVRIAYDTAVNPPLASLGIHCDIPFKVDIGIGETWSDSKKKANRLAL